MFMSVILVLFAMFLPVADAQAACGMSCTNPSTCADLGYEKGMECNEGAILCPFDSSYKWCKKYTCEDGRYYKAPLNASDGYACEAVDYHGLTCYDCDFDCPSGQYNIVTCWNGKLYALATDENDCSHLGYIDSKDDCTNYLACPADLNKVICIPES